MPGHKIIIPQTIFFFCGILLLPPILLMPLMFLSNIIDWIRNRREGNPSTRDLYVLPFRIGTHVIAGCCSYWVLTLSSIFTSDNLGFASLVAVVVAAAAYAILQHGIGHGLGLFQGADLEESGLLDVDGIFTKLALLLIGFGMALIWIINPWLNLLFILPGLVYYLVFIMPEIRREAFTDAKTGLSNMRHFNELFEDELARGARLNQNLAVIMVDVDDLGLINNTYGHLAGDGALMTVSTTILHMIRSKDIAARLGGEEFCIIVPETGPEEACALADSIRHEVTQVNFKAPDCNTVLHTSVSMGVAIFPRDGLSTMELLHTADVAMYQAKMSGKNRVVSALDLPRELRTDQCGRESTEVINYRAAFGMHEKMDCDAPVLNSHLAPKLSDKHGAASETNHRQPQEKTESVIPTTKSQKKGNNIAIPSDSTDTDVDENSFRSVPGSEESDRNEAAQIQDPHLPYESKFTTHRDYTPVTKTSIAIAPAHILPVHNQAPSGLSTLFVWGVTIMGIGAALFCFMLLESDIDLRLVALFGLIAMIVQLLQLSMYESSTISVSAAVILAATLLAGIPGLISTCSMVVLVHSIQYRPQLRKIGFNWSVHVLAGLSPLVIHGLGIPFNSSSIHILLLLVLSSALIYYVIESWLVAAAIGLSNDESILKTWENQFRWLMVHYVVAGCVALSMAIAYHALGIWGIGTFTMPVLLIYFSQKQYVARSQSSAQELNRMNRELSNANRDILLANAAFHQLNEELFLILSKIIDARDPDVHGHASQVATYASAIADEMGLSDEEIEKVRQGALLHDIGKLGIAECILHKPGPLTDEEFDTVKRHPALGADFLETCQGLRSLAPFVRYHHEWWDGTGYPAGLFQTQIPLGARILAVCDAVEAMASDRPYRKGLPSPQIINELDRSRGTQFDPAVIDAFKKVIRREGAEILKNTALHRTPSGQNL